MTNNARDPFEVLGVSRTAPDSVIKAAYRARIRETHPDAGGDPAEAQAVNDAYELLTDPDRRAGYLRSQKPAQQPQTPRSQPNTVHQPQEPHPAPQAAPERVYSTFGSPRAWWTSKLAWIPALLAVLVAGLVSGVAGVLFMSGALLIASLPRAKAVLWALLASAAAGAASGIVGADQGPSAVTGMFPDYWATPTAVFVAVILLWLWARRRHMQALLAHAADVFITTSTTHRLAPYKVTAITPGVLHLEPVHGTPMWPQPTAQDNGIVAVGDVVLIHAGAVLASATDEMLRAHQRRLAKMG